MNTLKNFYYFIHKKNNHIFPILLIIFFSSLLGPVILTGDSLKYYLQSENIANFILGNHHNELIIHNLFMTIHNTLIVLLSKIFIFKFLIINNWLIFIISFLYSFYYWVAFYICYLLSVKKIKNKISSLFLCFSLFFGTGLITFFSASYLENIVVLILFIRFYSDNRFFFLLTELSICLIKPYYFIFVIYFIFFHQKKVFDKISYQIYYSIVLFLLILILNLFFYTNHIEFNYAEINLKNVYTNFLDIFFSNSSGIINTVTFILILIIFGFKKMTVYKIILTLLFFIFLSFSNFWYAHLPMSGRYILSILPFFFPEILAGFMFLLKFKKFSFVFAFFVFTIFNNLINLPTINIKNTSFEHYSANAIANGNFKNVSIKQYYHPINDYKFHQFFLNYKYSFSIITSQKNLYFQNNLIDMENIYPAVGILRIKYAIQNYNKIKNIKIINNKFILYIESLSKIIYILIEVLIVFLILIYFLLQFLFLICLKKK